MTKTKDEIEITPKGSYAFVSLGCPKNTVDSERMLGLLQLDGYELVGDPNDADFVVVNTCGFIEEARKESYGAIDEMIELKNRGIDDVLTACVDGLKGFLEAIYAEYPETKIRLCIVHMVRNSLRLVRWKAYKAVSADLKLIYQASTELKA